MAVNPISTMNRGPVVCDTVYCSAVTSGKDGSNNTNLAINACLNTDASKYNTMLFSGGTASPSITFSGTGAGVGTTVSLNGVSDPSAASGVATKNYTDNKFNPITLSNTSLWTLYNASTTAILANNAIARLSLEPDGRTTFSSTNAIVPPSGTTAQRASTTNGQLRFNSTTSNLEAYIGSWLPINTQSLVSIYANGTTVTNFPSSTGGTTFNTNPLTTATTTTYGDSFGSLSSGIFTFSLAGTYRVKINTIVQYAIPNGLLNANLPAGSGFGARLNINNGATLIPIGFHEIAANSAFTSNQTSQTFSPGVINVCRSFAVGDTIRLQYYSITGGPYNSGTMISYSTIEIARIGN